MLRWYI